MYQIEYEMLTKSEWSNEFDDVCMIHECDYNKCISLYGIIMEKIMKIRVIVN